MTTVSVVLLHGMGRTRWSMRKPARALSGAGYHVVNLGYPSTIHRHSIQVVPQTHSFIMQDERVNRETVHFIQQGSFTGRLLHRVRVI